MNDMNLRFKFNLAMLVALAVGLLVGSVVLDRVVLNSAREQVLENARIMMSAANAVRTYTAVELVPLLPAEHDGKFVPQTIPSYAAQKQFKQVHADFAGYSYRETALNPTNLSDRAQDWEADIINAFRSDTQKQEFVVERETSTGATLYLARPIVVRQEACLTCHTTPAIAPPAMIQDYGSANGFGWKLNEIIGAQILAIPMTLPLKLARNAYWSFVMILGAIFSAIVIVMNVLLHYLVVQPVTRLSAMANAASLGEDNVPTYVKPGKDEISLLSVAFDRMRQSLDHAMAMLK
jgi:HAMP domain-containing protein